MQWRVREGDPAAEARLCSELGCSPLAARLLVLRGLNTPELASEFLHPDFARLADPSLLPDSESAIERICRALEQNERIYVHGDYDGDGITSAALWTRLLEKLGADVRAHVPHRYRDGYDLRSKFVAQAQAEGARLIITTDCGTQRYDEVEEARARGMDVIITDHHEPPSILPRAVAVVNPHRPDSRYPFADLAGVGVAYRLGELLVRRLHLSVPSYRKAYCDLAAIGTITDSMPLIGDNRVFVRHGLEALQDTQKAGLSALKRLAGLADRAVTSHQVGFVLGPRLNAIGRMDDARIALDLLLTRDSAQAEELAARLEQANLDRRTIEKQILDSALAQVLASGRETAPCIVVWGEDWHHGVLGIVANRLASMFHRPSAVISVSAVSDMARGSGRSVAPFDFHGALCECAELLGEYGGHAQAVGFEVEPNRLTELAERLAKVAGDKLKMEDLVPVMHADAIIEPSALGLELVDELSLFEPWGHANPEPVLLAQNLPIVELRRVGQDLNHLRLRVLRDSSTAVTALAWGEGELEQHLREGDRVDICFQARSNTFNGTTSLQMVIKDIRHTEPAA